jgi:AMMECR1 domain-containing protein
MALLTPGEQQTLLTAARAALQAFVKTGRAPTEAPLRSPGLQETVPAVVSLSALGQPRGSVGDLEPAGPLYRSVPELAIEAASSDQRAAPITPAELHQVRISVDLLRDLAPLPDLASIEIGQTGLALPGSSPVILLPELAVRNRWTESQFLAFLMQQAGLRAGDTPGRILRFVVERFGEEDDDQENEQEKMQA